MSDCRNPGSVFTTGLSVPAGTPVIGESGIDGHTYPNALAAITRHAALYAVRFVGRDDAMDVAQNVVAELNLQFSSDPSFPDKSTPLISIVRDLTTSQGNAYRKKKASQCRAEGTHARERAASIAIQLDPERAVYEADMRKLIAKIEDRSSPVASQAFTMSRQEGRSYQQIAEAQQTTRSRAKKRIMMVLGASRTVLGEADIPAPPPLGKSGSPSPKPKGGGKANKSPRRSASDNPPPRRTR